MTAHGNSRREQRCQCNCRWRNLLTAILIGTLAIIGLALGTGVSESWRYLGAAIGAAVGAAIAMTCAAIGGRSGGE